MKIERDERSDEEGGLRLPSGRQAGRQGSNIINLDTTIQCSFPVSIAIYCIILYPPPRLPSSFLDVSLKRTTYMLLLMDEETDDVENED